MSGQGRTLDFELVCGRGRVFVNVSCKIHGFEWRRMVMVVLLVGGKNGLDGVMLPAKGG